MIAVDPGNMAGGMLGLALLCLVLGAYGYLLIGRFFSVNRGSLFEVAGVCVLIGFLALSWLGSILAVASLFTWWLFAIAAVGVVILARRWSRSLPLGPAPLGSTSGLAQVAVVLLLAGAAWLYARPTESWLVFDDSAVYGMAGVHLAEMGTLIPSVEVLLCRGHHAFRFFGPFRWWDGCEPALSVGFLPVPKVWAGFAAWLFGPSGAVWSAPLAGILALLAWFLFVRRAVGVLPALVATALVTVAFPQVWYSRTIMSETFTQITLFGGLYLLLLERETNSTARLGIWGIGSALMMGLLALIRFEAVLFLTILVAAWLAANVFPAREGPVRWPAPWVPRWLGCVFLLTLLAMGLSFASTPHYYLDQMVKLMTRSTITLSLLAVAVLAAAIALLRRSGVQRLWNAVARRPLAHVAILALVAAWWLVTALDLLWGGGPFRDVALWLPLYLGWAGVVLGAAGLAWLALKPTVAPEAYALLLLALLMATIFVIRPLVTRVHPWAIRRYVPFIIPALALGIGLFYDRVWAAVVARTKRRGSLWRWPVGLVLAVLVVISIALFGRTTLPFVHYREMAGLWDQLEDLASLYPEDAILVFDHGPYGQRIPQAMELVFGYSVLGFLEPLNPNLGEGLEALVESAHEEGRRVFVNVIDGDLMWQPTNYGLESYAAYIIQAPRVRYERTPPPTADSIATMSFVVDIYEIVPLSELSIVQNLTVTIPIGEGSYPYLRGVHGLELDHKGRLFRWTREEARITVPVPQALPSPRATIALDVGAWRAPGAGETVMVVTAQGTVLLEAEVEHRVEPQRFLIEVDSIQRPHLAPLTIGIQTETWQPLEYGIEDGRELGLILYGVTVTFDDADDEPDPI